MLPPNPIDLYGKELTNNTNYYCDELLLQKGGLYSAKLAS